MDLTNPPQGDSTDVLSFLQRPAHDPVKVIDVRTPTEFQAVHIPGSVNVPLDVLTEYADEVAARFADRPDAGVVLVCRSGARSEQARRVLRSAAPQATDVQVLAGGTDAYVAAGNPVVRGQQRWAMDRQVRLVAGSLVAATTVASIWWPATRFLAGAVGAGLITAAITDSCGLSRLLARLPHNQVSAPPPARVVLERLDEHG